MLRRRRNRIFLARSPDLEEEEGVAVPGNFLSAAPRNGVSWVLTAPGATSQETSLIPPRERPSVSIE